MSVHRRRLIVAPEARQDLSDILLYTGRRCGKRQRTIYKAELDEVMRDLTQFPNLGRARDDLSPALRSHLMEQHVVYYRVDDRAITIIRVLHERMDTAAELP